MMRINETVIDQEEVKKNMELLKDNTSYTKTYSTKGEILIQSFDLIIDLCDRITELENELAKKPKGETKIRYVERRNQ